MTGSKPRSSNRPHPSPSKLPDEELGHRAELRVLVAVVGILVEGSHVLRRGHGVDGDELAVRASHRGMAPRARHCGREHRPRLGSTAVATDEARDGGSDRAARTPGPDVPSGAPHGREQPEEPDRRRERHLACPWRRGRDEGRGFTGLQTHGAGSYPVHRPWARKNWSHTTDVMGASARPARRTDPPGR